MKFEFPDLKEIALLAIFGGIAFLVLTFATGLVGGIGDSVFAGVGSILITIGLIVLFLTFGKMVKVDDINFAELIVLLAGISIVGAIVAMVFPMAGFLVLSTSNLFGSINTLLLVLTSLVLGQWSAKMVGLA